MAIGISEAFAEWYKGMASIRGAFGVNRHKIVKDITDDSDVSVHLIGTNMYPEGDNIMVEIEFRVSVDGGLEQSDSVHMESHNFGFLLGDLEDDIL